MKCGTVLLTLTLVFAPVVQADAMPASKLAHSSYRTRALFNLGITIEPFIAPFPSDRFTVTDGSQNTGRRVNLPYPKGDCINQPVPTDPACFPTYTVNFLDGFNVQPRLSIPFSGPIDPNTVNSDDVFLVSLGSTLSGGASPGRVIGINQIVWEVANNTLHVESDDLLEQHAVYALIVTNGIHDPNGNSVSASDTFNTFPLRLLLNGDPALRKYGAELTRGLLSAIAAKKIPLDTVVTASVFTTQSVTADLEKIRDQIKDERPAPTDFNIGPNGGRAVFNFSDIALVTFNQQFGDDPSDPRSYGPYDTGIETLLHFFPVGLLAFGRFSSPSYINADVIIPPVGTLTGHPTVQRINEVYFDLIVPSGPKPPTGWPVTIYGHGANGSKDLNAADIAGELSSRGIATIIINAVGQGWGPASTVDIQRTDRSVVRIPAPGRGYDQDNDGFITAGDGGNAIGANAPGNRDSQRQTVIDWMQLVREIQVGIDIDGDGKPDLDPSRIYHAGLSLGGIEGTIFDAIEPAVHSSVINSAGGAEIDFLRLSPINADVYTFVLASQTPSLLNGPNETYIDDTPLRNQPPVINDIPGAEAIQNFDDIADWALQAGNPVPYAQHLRKEPLLGVGPKSVIVSFAKGDKIVPNPAETALVRAGDLRDRTTYFRTDVLVEFDPTLASGGVATGAFPHIFMNDFVDDSLSREIAFDAGEQVAQFFASEGASIVSPQVIDPRLHSGLFEVPIVGPLPEDLNFIF
jgi:dienelactone hydrolase